MGIRIDLRTLIHGLLHRPQIRAVMTSSQKSRALYYHLRICAIFIECYKSIRMTFIESYLRHFQKIKKNRGKGYWTGFSDTRNPYFMKNLFGKILQKYFITAFSRLFFKMRRQNENLFSENLFGEVSNTLDYRVKSREVKSAIRGNRQKHIHERKSSDPYVFLGIYGYQ